MVVRGLGDVGETSDQGRDDFGRRGRNADSAAVNGPGGDAGQGAVLEMLLSRLDTGRTGNRGDGVGVVVHGAGTAAGRSGQSNNGNTNR